MLSLKNKKDRKIDVFIIQKTAFWIMLVLYVLASITYLILK